MQNQRSIRKAILIAGICAILAVTVLGVPFLVSSAKVVREGAIDKVEDMSSLETIHSKFLTAVRDQQERIESFSAKVAKQHREVSRFTREAEKLEGRLENKRDVIHKAVSILEKHEGEPLSTEIEINGCTYSLKEVQEDLDMRVKMCKEIETRIAQNREEASKWRKVLGNSKGHLHQMQDKVVQLVKEADKVRRRIEQTKLEGELLKSQAALAKTPMLSDDSEPRRLLAQMQERLDEQSARNEHLERVLGTVVQDQSGINYGLDNVSVVSEAKKYLASNDYRPDVGAALERAEIENE